MAEFSCWTTNGISAAVETIKIANETRPGHTTFPKLRPPMPRRSAANTSVSTDSKDTQKRPIVSNCRPRVQSHFNGVRNQDFGSFPSEDIVLFRFTKTAVLPQANIQYVEHSVNQDDNQGPVGEICERMPNVLSALPPNSLRNPSGEFGTVAGDNKPGEGYRPGIRPSKHFSKAVPLAPVTPRSPVAAGGACSGGGAPSPPTLRPSGRIARAAWRRSRAR
jgi:hypothetical protein